MLHLHTSFDLDADISIREFSEGLREFSALMQAEGLLESTGQIAERCLHPIMDTDGQRSHQYFFVMSFKDRAQCDAAVSYIQAQHATPDKAHKNVYQHVVDPIFSCWIDKV
jgi:hypothetical protein